MSEQHGDPLDRELVEALGSVHARYQVPVFEEVWDAAQTAAKRPAHRRLRWPHAPVAWAAVVAVAAVVGVAMRLPTPAPQEAHDLLAWYADHYRDQAVPIVWYAPTDELLQVPSLGYAARPAAMTIYDPINLEVRP